MKWKIVKNTFFKDRSKEKVLSFKNIVKTNPMFFAYYGAGIVSVISIFSIYLFPMQLLLPVFMGFLYLFCLICHRIEQEENDIENLINSALDPKDTSKNIIKSKTLFMLEHSQIEWIPNKNGGTISVSIKLDEKLVLDHKNLDYIRSDIFLLSKKMDEVAYLEDQVIHDGPINWKYEHNVLILKREFKKHPYNMPIMPLPTYKLNLTMPKISNDYNQKILDLQNNLPYKYHNDILKIAKSIEIAENLNDIDKIEILKKVDERINILDKHCKELNS